MVLSQSLGYLCSYMKFKFLFFLSASKSKSLQLFLQKKEVESDIIGIRTAVLETETNSLYHYTNGIRLQVMFSFCIFIVCLVKVKKTTAKTVYEQPCSTSDAKKIVISQEDFCKD